ncbi:MAG TPA: dienelactone hydrolase family protein [Acidimicrobiia bacterium]|nr:dienelactone hydrolase family protein [Acidimicrobiia bacterium]
MTTLAEGPIDDVEVERITLTGEDGAPVEAVHARPTGMPSAGLVLHPDIGGLRPLFEDMSRRLATYGLSVICPEPFARAQAAGVDLGDLDRRTAYMHELDDETQLGDLARAADRLVVDDGISDVSVLGFCMGGMYALKAAATERFDRAVAFYPMVRVPDTWKGPSQTDALDTAAGVCPTLALFAGQDHLVPSADVEALRVAWADRPDCEIVVYAGAEHGFAHDADRPTHRADDAADAWRRTVAFLGVGS